MKFIELKVTYEWFTPKGKRRTFYDFAFGISQMECILTSRKYQTKNKNENYKVLKYEWFTPMGKRRTFYDFAFGISQMECIDNIVQT